MSPAKGTFESQLSGKMGELRLEDGSTRYIGGTSHLIYMGKGNDSAACAALDQHVLLLALQLLHNAIEKSLPSRVSTRQTAAGIGKEVAILLAVTSQCYASIGLPLHLVASS
jgi:hypothetical protein